MRTEERAVKQENFIDKVQDMTIIEFTEKLRRNKLELEGVDDAAAVLEDL